MAVLPRNILKTFFQKNDIPTESQFGSLIDSALSLTEDRKLLGLKKYDPSVTYAVGDSAVKDGLIYEAIAVTTGPFDSTKWQKLTFGPVNYVGTWDATANTPTLVSSTGNKGDYYVVSTAGTTNLDGINDWQVRDWVVFNGSVWQKVDNSEGQVPASLVTYDNSVSGMLAVDVQDAIDELDVRLDTVETDIGTLQSGKEPANVNIQGHIATVGNPHGTTKTDLGLGNVDNTSDAAKPVSTAQQAALDLKTDLTSFNAHTGDTANPHAVTKAQVGLGNADNTSDANKPVSTAQQAALDLKTDLTAFNVHTGDTANPHAVTKAQVGLVNADNTSDADKPVSTAQQSALNLKTDLTTFNAHTGNTSNPHAVTKAQVGLGNADNTSDADKPVSTAQQSALDLKTDLTSFTAHTGNTSNPHAVTKAQVGLGNADNTSDANKPVSTAQQAALDLKTDLTAFTAHTGNTSNPHAVTKTQVGLGNVTDDQQQSHKFYFFDSPSEATLFVNTTTGFIPTITMGFTPAVAGDYLVEWYYEIGSDSGNGNVEGQVTLDSTEIGLHSEKIDIADTLISVSGFKKETLTAAAHTLDVKFRKISGAAGVEIWLKRPRVKITKV